MSGECLGVVERGGDKSADMSYSRPDPPPTPPRLLHDSLHLIFHHIDNMTVSIHTLPPIASSSGDSASLREQIELALSGDGQSTVPGDRPEDKQWAFKRSVPTVVLYDQEGLR